MPSPETPPPDPQSSTTRRVPVFEIVAWRDAEVDVATCQHPVILRFVGAVDHIAYRCAYCDQRLDVTTHAYAP